MRSLSRDLAAFAFAAALALSGGCTVLGAPSSVRAGVLYAPGSPRYDAYFGEVHAQQVSAGAWANEKKAARRALIDALKVAPDADDVAITESTKDRLSSGVLRLEVHGSDVHVVEATPDHEGSSRGVIAALEQTAHAEVARAGELAEVPARVDALAKAGHELEAHMAEDFAGDGQKPFDVREELHASYEVLATIAEGAQREQKVAEQFVAELGRAVSSGNEVPVFASKGGAGAGARASGSAVKPAPRTVTKPAPAPRAEPVAAAAPRPAPPPPKPPPPPAASEVFNP